MRVSLVVRGDEWISSVPLHLQLFDALGFPRIRYAHIAPLMKQAGGSRRKLSKRSDPEASVGFYIEQGYPAEAVQYYLRGLANGRLAEMPLREALATPIRAVRVRRRRAAGQPGQARRHQRRLHCHPARRGHPGPGDHLGAGVRSAAGRGAYRLARGGAGGAGHRAGGCPEPAQGPAPLGGLPHRVRVLLPAAVRPGDRRRGRAVRRAGAGGGPFGGRGVRAPVPAARPGHRMVRADPRAGRRPRVRAQSEGIQEGPGRLPRLDPGGVADHPGAADRHAPQPGPGRRGRGARAR